MFKSRSKSSSSGLVSSGTNSWTGTALDVETETSGLPETSFRALSSTVRYVVRFETANIKSDLISFTSVSFILTDRMWL